MKSLLQVMIELHEKSPDYRPLPKGHSYGMKTVDPLRRTHSGFTWPAVGRSVRSWVGADRGSLLGDPCPRFVGDGLCVALTPAGAMSGGLNLGGLLLVSYRDRDVVGADNGNKIRTKGLVRVRDEWANLRQLLLSWLAAYRHSGNGVDLSHLYLRGIDFSYLGFAGCDLTYTIFERCNLTYTIFERCNLIGASFRGIVTAQPWGGYRRPRVENCFVQDMTYLASEVDVALENLGRPRKLS